MVYKRNIFKGVTLSMLLLAALAGCMNAAQNPQEGSGTTGTSSAQTSQTTTAAASQTSQTTTAAKTREDQFTDELLKESEIKSGKVYIQDDVVVCTMIIKDDANTENAKKLAQRYADKLKNAYNGKQVNVQAVQKGKNIADIDA